MKKNHFFCAQRYIQSLEMICGHVFSIENMSTFNAGGKTLNAA